MSILLEAVKNKIGQTASKLFNPQSFENIGKSIFNATPLGAGYNSYKTLSSPSFQSKIPAPIKQAWNDQPFMQVSRIVPPLIKGFSESMIYNPQTKRIFPQSPLYPENAFILNPKTPEENRKQTEQMTNLAMGLTGGTKTLNFPQHQALKTLSQLVNYGDDLSRMGYSKPQIDKIGVGEARKIISGNVAPFEHPTFAPEASEAKMAGDRLTLNSIFNKGNILNKVKALPTDIQTNFQKWVNNRRAGEISGVIAKKPFQQLDNEGLEAFYKIQAGEKRGIYGDLRKYFDKTHADIKATGLDINYQKNYLNQLWINENDQVIQDLNKSLTQKPSFSIDKVIETYKKGIALGKTPRFNKVSDLVGWYQSYANKTIADRTFFNELLKSKLIVPPSHAPKDWVDLAEGFPKYNVKMASGTNYQGAYKAPAELAEVINGYLNKGSEILSVPAQFTTKVKNMGLSGGIPNTSINAHGVNLFSRYVLSSKNPLVGLWHGIKWTLNPNSASQFVNQRLGSAEKFVRNGLTLSTEDMAFTRMEKEISKNVAKQGYKKIADIQEKLFEDPLFRKTVSAYKIDLADQVYQDLIKNGMKDQEALRQASKTANNILGGINLDEIGRNKDFQNILRTVILAPDWSESTIRTGGKIIEGIVNPKNWFKPEFNAYRVFARNLILGLVSMNLTNKLLSGHWSFENEGNNVFSLDTNTYTYDGKKRFLKPFGTSIDFLRVPVEVATGIGRGETDAVNRVLTNRLSLPAGAGLHLLLGTDYLGRPIYKNKYTGEPLPLAQQAGSIGNELMSGLGIPSSIRAGVDVLSGKSNLEQGVAQAGELPLRYTGGTYSASAKQLQDINPVTHKALYDQNQMVKGQSKLGKNQEAQVRSDFSSLQSIYEQRRENAQDTKIKEEVKQTGQPQKSDNKVFYLDSTGTTKSVDISYLPPKPVTTGDYQIDKELLTKYRSALTSQRSKVIDAIQNGAVTFEEVKNTLSNLQTKKAEVTAPKVKKLAKVTLKKVKLQKPKAAKKIKLPKLKKLSKLKKIKLLTSKPLKVS